MGLCQRQLVDSVVEDWWLFPRKLLLFWMRQITKQRGSEASPYFDVCFARMLCGCCKISPYVRAYLYPTECHEMQTASYHVKITTLIKQRWSQMIRMSETTRTHTPGKQLDCDILISSLMKHVPTNRPMFQIQRGITHKNLGHKIYLL